MRKLYNEFLYAPRHAKIRDKVMLTRVTLTITIMIMCLAAMSITAYAYFSHNVTSASNTIQAANFETNVLITITNSNNDSVTVTKDGKVQTATLDAGEYTVSLSKGASTANTGFCIITINDTDYFTQQIGNDVERGLTDGSAEVIFKLKVPSATTIEILSHWGTSKYYGYKDEGRPEIFIDSDGYFLDLTNGEGDKSEDNTEQSEETTTTPSTDTTTPTTGTESSTPATETTTPAETTTPETTRTSEPTTTTEPSSTTEPSNPANTTEPAATEPEETTESTETQSTEEIHNRKTEFSVIDEEIQDHEFRDEGTQTKTD